MCVVTIERMERNELERLVGQLMTGQMPVEQFLDQVQRRRTADVGDARVDLDRQRRCGFPEVVYGEGKSVEALIKIFEALLSDGVEVLATRISADKASELLPTFRQARYNDVARCLRIPTVDSTPVESTRASSGQHSTAGPPRVAIVTAGTADLPVAEEARETLDWMGVEVELISDVGVAGPHRLPEQVDRLTDVDAIVVVAGMEGALPSIVGGYVACPVFGVPTSVGYGASFGGIAPLLSMLNSCAANVAVVNIDAGFKAAYLAGLIATRAATARQTAEEKEPQMDADKRR